MVNARPPRFLLLVDATAASVALLVAWVAWPGAAERAVTIAGFAIVAAPLRDVGRPPEERGARRSAALWLVPGLAIAAACAFVARYVGPAAGRLLALAPVGAWIAGALGAQIRVRRAPSPVDPPRLSVWIGATCVLALLSAGILARDRGRASPAVYEASLSSAAAPQAVAVGDDGCSARDDLPPCRYAVGGRTCFGVASTFPVSIWEAVSDSAANYDNPAYPARPGARILGFCPTVTAVRTPHSGHLAVEVTDDARWGDHLGSGARSVMVLTGDDARPSLSVWDSLGEVAAPPEWKFLAFAALLVGGALVGVRSRQETVAGVRRRHAILWAAVGVAPLAVAAAAGVERHGPEFAETPSFTVAPPTKRARPGVGYVFVPPQASEGDWTLDRVDVGSAPRWGIAVAAPGDYVIAGGGRSLSLHMSEGESWTLGADGLARVWPTPGTGSGATITKP